MSRPWSDGRRIRGATAASAAAPVGFDSDTAMTLGTPGVVDPHLFTAICDCRPPRVGLARVICVPPGRNAPPPSIATPAPARQERHVHRAPLPIGDQRVTK